MAKTKKLAAPEVVYMMGLTPPAQTPDGKDIKYGRQAVVGQYTKPYTREGHTPPGRVSKGAQARYDKAHGSEGTLDLSAVINARR
mgnify:CR=1 FL=1